MHLQKEIVLDAGEQLPSNLLCHARAVCIGVNAGNIIPEGKHGVLSEWFMLGI